MKSNNKILTIAAATVIGIGMALPVFAQETTGSANPSASTSMSQAGSDTASAAKNAYHGAVTAIDDTTITAAVKTSLAAAKDLRSGQIHVTTVAGVVTLEGVVHDSEIVARVEKIARNASGVQDVKNELTVSSSVPKD